MPSRIFKDDGINLNLIAAVKLFFVAMKAFKELKRLYKTHQLEKVSDIQFTVEKMDNKIALGVKTPEDDPYV